MWFAICCFVVLLVAMCCCFVACYLLFCCFHLLLCCFQSSDKYLFSSGNFYLQMTESNTEVHVPTECLISIGKDQGVDAGKKTMEPTT